MKALLWNIGLGCNFVGLLLNTIGLFRKNKMAVLSLAFALGFILMGLGAVNVKLQHTLWSFSGAWGILSLLFFALEGAD